MKSLLIVGAMFTFSIAFAQRGGQGQNPQNNAAVQKVQAMYDSLTPQQKNSFMINVKHVMDPEVKYVQPGKTDDTPPADAIVLFDGINANSEWEETAFDANRVATVKPAVTWAIKDGAMAGSTGSGSIRTKRKFEDFQLHLEWKIPADITGEGQARGNSGVQLLGNYEIQILDSYNNRTYRNGQAGALYMQYAPLVNVSRKPGEWQSFDIIFTAPRFKDETTYLVPGRVTVIHNGVVVQNNVVIQGPTASPGLPYYNIQQHGPGPITLLLQRTPVAFRNIWVRPL